MFRDIRASFCLLAFFTVLTGICYPLLMTGAGHAVFPFQAGGSLLQEGGRIIGSSLIGQTFTSPGYFHARPSAAGTGYDAANSSASNLAPSSADLAKTYAARVAELQAGGDAKADIPVDLITASGSGLDPDISLAAARFEAPRVAEARGMSVQEVMKLIGDHAHNRAFGILGENTVNVVELNRALDALRGAQP